MAKSQHSPSRRQVKRGVEELIIANDPLLAVSDNTLVYRIRKRYGWQIQTGKLILRVVHTKAVIGAVQLLERSGKPYNRVTDPASVGDAAGCRVISGVALRGLEPTKSPVTKATKPAPQVQLPAPRQPLPMVVVPERKLNCTLEMLLEMILLHLWLTPEAEIQDNRDVEVKLAGHLGFIRYSAHEDFMPMLQDAVDLGYETGRLDVYPYNSPVLQRIMNKMVPTKRLVDDLKRKYPLISSGREWPPRP